MEHTLASCASDLKGKKTYSGGTTGVRISTEVLTRLRTIGKVIADDWRCSRRTLRGGHEPEGGVGAR